MPVTSPDSIYYADGSTPMSAEDISAAEATSVQTAFTNKITNKRQIQTFVWANTAARTAQTGMIAGDFGYQTDTGVTYRYGSSWVAFYPSGLVAVVPTSVAGTGVSYSTTTGLVTFATSTAVNVNGCFTSGFRNYRIIVHVTATSVSAGAQLRLRAAGTDSSTASDYSQNNAYWTTTGTFANSTGLTGWSFTNIAGTSHQGEIELYGPQLSAVTTGKIESGTYTGATPNVGNYLRVRQNLTTAYDGFSFITSAGNATGTLKVYGYN